MAWPCEDEGSVLSEVDERRVGGWWPVGQPREKCSECVRMI